MTRSSAQASAATPCDVRPSKTVAISGSKGGVGKSSLVVNLAVALGRWGRQVLVVDGDLGLGNLDLLLGLSPPRNVRSLVSGEASLEELLVDGPPGVRVLPAASGVPELLHLDRRARQRLTAALRAGADLADDVLVDTGAGLGNTSLALQAEAERMVVVTTPEPTSLVDAYATLKVVWGRDPGKRIDLVVNAVANDAEACAVYERLATAAERFLHRTPGWLGAVYRDPKLEESVRRQTPLLELFPGSRAGRCFERIALRLTADGLATPTLDESALGGSAGPRYPH